MVEQRESPGLHWGATSPQVSDLGKSSTDFKV